MPTYISLWFDIIQRYSNFYNLIFILNFNHLVENSFFFVNKSFPPHDIESLFYERDHVPRAIFGFL